MQNDPGSLGLGVAMGCQMFVPRRMAEANVQGSALSLHCHVKLLTHPHGYRWKLIGNQNHLRVYMRLSLHKFSKFQQQISVAEKITTFALSTNEQITLPPCAQLNKLGGALSHLVKRSPRIGVKRGFAARPSAS